MQTIKETKIKLTRPEKAAQVAAILADPPWSETTFKHFIPGVLYTEGVHALAEAAGAHWLIDVIASYQPSLRRTVSKFSGEKGIPFQIWRLVVDLDNRAAVATCHEDWNEEKPDKYPAIVTQEIPHTDFPAAYLRLYCEGNNDRVTILCPRER